MNVKKVVTYRLLQSFVTFLGISVLIFFLARVIPGDPAAAILGEEARPEQIEKLRSEMHLDKPFFVQYFIFLSSLIRKGEIGMSSQTSRDAMRDALFYFPATLELVATSMGIALCLGIVLGVISSGRRNTWVDHFIRLFTIGGVSIPQFLVAIAFQLLISYGLGILPTTGRLEALVDPPAQVTGLYVVDSLLAGNLAAFRSALMCLILPSLSLALSPTAWITRYTRASMADEHAREYVTVSEANGLLKNLLTYRHMLRNAISPVLTQASLAFAFLLGNAFIIETIFAWPGMASYMQKAAIYKDVNGIVAVTLVVAVFYLLINFLVDLAYVYLDPRVRL